MGQFTHPVKNLINGVSQQDPTIKLDNQVNEQINLISDTTFGLIKRNPVNFISKYKGNNWENRVIYNFKKIIDGVENLYFLLRPDYFSNNSEQQNLQIYNATTGELTTVMYPVNTVDNSSYIDYLYMTEKKDIVVEENNDNIYILNTKKVVTKEEDIAINTNCQGILWINSALHRDVFYTTIVITDGTTDYTYNAQVAISAEPGVGGDAEPDLYEIANEFVNKINAISTPAGQPDFNCGFQANVVYLRLTGGTGTWKIKSMVSTCSTAASAIGSVLNAEMSDDFIADPAVLPKFSPDVYGITMKVRIKIDPRDNKLTYILGNIAQGWVETTLKSVIYPVDKTTFIHYIDKNDLGFIRPLGEIKRLVGDEESNVDPTFIGKKINDIVIFNDRLVIATDNTLVMSEIKDFTHFYKTSAATFLPTDRIDVELDASKLNYNFIKNINIINGQLIINTGTSQALFLTTTGVNIAQSRLSLVSTYSLGDNRSIPLENTLVFASTKKGYIQLNQYKLDAQTGTSFLSDGLNEHCSNYIPGTVKQLKYDGGVLVVLTNEDKKTLYINNRFSQNNQLIRNSFSKFSFDLDIEYVNFIDNKLCIILTNGDVSFITNMDLFYSKKENNSTVTKYTQSTLEIPGFSTVVSGSLSLELLGEQLNITPFEFNNIGSFITKINTFSFLNGTTRTITATKVGNKITMTYNGFSLYSPLRVITFDYATTGPFGWSSPFEESSGVKFIEHDDTQVTPGYTSYTLYDGDLDIVVAKVLRQDGVSLGSIVIDVKSSSGTLYRYSFGASLGSGKYKFYKSFNIDKTYQYNILLDNISTEEDMDVNHIEYIPYIDIALNYVDSELILDDNLVAINVVTGQQYDTVEEAQSSFDPILYGYNVKSKVELSKQVLRIQGNNDFTVVHFGNLFLRRIKFLTSYTGEYLVRIANKYIETRESLMRTHGLGEIPLNTVQPTERTNTLYSNGNSEDLKIELESNNSTPFNLIGFEWIGIVKTKGRRV